jgi:tight adherence protein B
MHVLLSLTLAAGLLLTYLSLSSSGADAAQPESGSSWLTRVFEWSGADGIGIRELALVSAAGGVIAALLAHTFFGWPVVTLASFVVGLILPSWYFRQRAERRRAEVQEAVGEAVEALRDAVRIGLGLEEAIRALGRTGPLALRPVFQEMDRDFRLSGFEQALRRARVRVAEPLFDTLAVALLTAYRIGGRNLAAVLDGLSRSVRGSVQARREVRANQAENVLSARVIAALPLVLILSIRATNPDYLDVFSTPGGQGVLALCLLSVAVGYAMMLRATALPDQGRVIK